MRASLWRNARRACVGILPFCQKANTAEVLSPRPFARRHLAANSDVVDRGDPGPATRSKMALWEHGVCLCLDLGEERGTFGRPEPTTGARRPHAFEGNIPERGRETLVPAAASRDPELLAGAPSRAAGWPMDLCTRPPLQRERYRCDPATSVKIEVNRGRYRQLLFAALYAEEWLASAIACLDRQWRHSCDSAGRHEACR